MKRLVILLLLIYPLSSQGQPCDCNSTFDWLKKTFEENDAGFQYIVDKKGKLSYDLHNKIFREEIRSINTASECQSTIREWLSFFRKAHVEFHYTGEITSDTREHAASDESFHDVDLSPELLAEPVYQLHQKFKISDVPFTKRLTEKTFYLRIPSFQGNEKHLVDSTILAHRSEILSTENLIIDIRNGTGGNDDCYEEIIPLLYTNPIRLPSLVFYSTPLNNQRMYQMATNTGLALEWGVNPTKEEMVKYMADFDTLNNHLGEFVNLGATDINITALDTVYPFPKQVGILINHNNVSTDEQFILEAKQSKKVKLFGTTTMGGLDISNLNITFSPAKDFVLVYGLSKSLRIPNMVVDDIGIMPDFYIDKNIPEYDWINYVQEILEK